MPSARTTSRASTRRRGLAERQVDARHLDLAGGWPSTVRPLGLVPPTTWRWRRAPPANSPRQRAEVEPRHHLADRPLRRDLPADSSTMRGREPRHLGERVADVEDRRCPPRRAAARYRAGSRALRASSSEASGSSISSSRGRGQQRAADRDALLLAARKRAGPAVEQRADAEQVDDLGRGCRAAARRRRTSGHRAGCGARSDAGTAGRPGTRSRCGAGARHEDAALRCRAAARRRATIRPRSGRSRPAIDVDQRGLAGSRAAEQRRHAGRRLAKRDVEIEARRARLATSTSSIRCRAPCRRHRPRQQLGGEQRGEGDGDRDQRQPQRAGLAAGDLGEGVDRRAAGSGSRPGCWRRR